MRGTMYVVSRALIDPTNLGTVPCPSPMSWRSAAWLGAPSLQGERFYVGCGGDLS